MTRGSIRTRTMWGLFAVGGLAALLVGLVTMATMTQELYRQVGTSNRTLAKLLLAHVREEIEDGEALLQRAGTRLEAVPFDTEHLDPVLEDALFFHPIFDSIYAYGADGEVVLRRYPTEVKGDEGRSKNLREKDDPEFVSRGLNTLQDGRTRKLPVRMTRTGSLFIPVLTGVRGPDDSVKGMLSGGIFAAGKGFREMIEDMAPGRGGYVILLDSENRVLARSPRAPGTVGEVLPVTSEQRFGELLLRRPKGVDLAAEAQMPEVRLRVLVALPRDEALEALPGVLAKIALAALVALVLAGLLGVWLAERLTGPIREVLEGIRRVGDGVLTHRVPVEGDDELAEVGQAFNKLAESLARNRMIEEFWTDPALEDAEEGEGSRRAGDPGGA